MLLPDHLGLSSPFGMLLAAADASDRLRFGTHVLNVEFWNPALLARECATADVLTDGRLEVGLGAGHAVAEFRAAGLWYPRPAERVDHLAELVPLLRRLLAGEEVTSEGHYRLDRAKIGLPTVQARVPVMVGGNGDRVLAVAARDADIVGLVGFTAGTGPDDNTLTHFDWEGLRDRVAHVRRAAGPRAADLQLSVLLQAVELTSDRRVRAEVMAPAFERPAELLLDSPFVMIGTTAELADHVRRLRADFGVTYLTVPERSAQAFAQVMEQVR
ncbi:MAG: hypothetical protein QOI99_575 [Actinomycetota bacterium]|jgi:probable F420-dependent oxidoreductase|nr:hypothetical protein [Actinomycetota bacterium]